MDEDLDELRERIEITLYGGALLIPCALLLLWAINRLNPFIARFIWRYGAKALGWWFFGFPVLWLFRPSRLWDWFTDD